jgi:hypothetical protein
MLELSRTGGKADNVKIRQDARSKYTEVCEVSLTKTLRGKTNLDWKSLGKS